MSRIQGIGFPLKNNMESDNMINLKALTPNIPRVRLDDYLMIVAGERKTGKTELFVKLIHQYFKDIKKGLILAFEPGFTAQYAYAQPITNWREFEEVIKQLVDAKDPDADEEDKLPFEYLCLDTIDRAWDMCVDQVIREYNIKHAKNGKRATEINDIPYGMGHKTAQRKIRDAVQKLIDAGYGVYIITHTKKVENKNTEQMELYTSMPDKCKEVFENWADIIMFMTKEDEEGNPERKIHFKTNGYVQAGTRFKMLPQSVDYDDEDVEGFIKVLEDGIKKSIEHNMGVSIDMEKMKQEQKEEKEEKAKEYVKSQKSNEDMIKEIDAFIESLPKSKRATLANKFNSAIGKANYHAFDANELEQAMEIIEEMKNE